MDNPRKALCLSGPFSTGLQPSLNLKRGFCQDQFQPQVQLGPTSEISSQAGEGDFEDNLLVSTPSPQVQQVLVVQAQNGVNMASGTATTSLSTTTTAPSTAPLQGAGPSTMEPIVIQLGQDTPSVFQGARPDVGTEQTAQSTQRYGTLPYIPGPQYTAPTAPLPYAAPYATMPAMSTSMPAMSARPAAPMGYYGQFSQFPFMPNPGWITEEQIGVQFGSSGHAQCHSRS